MVSQVSSYTRIDLKTHHIVSYEKPLVIVDDFLQTTLKFSFGSDIAQRLTYYKSSFNQLVTAFKVPYQPLLDNYLVLFNYLGIKPISRTAREFFHLNRTYHKCPIQATTADIAVIGDQLGLAETQPVKAFYQYWEERLERLRFYTRSHFWHTFCPRDYTAIKLVLADYNEQVYNGSVKWCAANGYDMKINHYNTSEYYPCDTVQWQHDPLPHKRTRRWDASQVCGWPLISTAAKLFGGECTTNVDVTALKQNLRDMQYFAENNTNLISNLQHQLEIVNARTNLHYEQLQQLVLAIHEHQNSFIVNLNNLVAEIQDQEKAQSDRIGLNSIIISYTNSLFRVYQTLVDYRFAYIEILNSIEQHYHYPSSHFQHLDPEILKRLEAVGYTIPIHEGLVPYAYSKVRYDLVPGYKFFDLSFDVFIPVIKTAMVTSYVDEKFFYSNLSPLPLGVDANNSIFSTYIGPAICNQERCFSTPINGFCREGENYWYCSREYFETLHEIRPVYTRPLPHTSDVVFVPPHTVYFVRNTTYILGMLNYKAFAGTVLILTCDSVFKTPHTPTITTHSYLDCTNITTKSAFISDNPEPFIPIVDIAKLEQLYFNTTLPTLKLNTQSFNYTLNITDDAILSQQYDKLKQEFNEKISQLSIENLRILQQIHSMKAVEGGSSFIFYIIVGVLLLFALKFLHII